MVLIRNIWFDMGGIIFTQDTPEAFRRFSSLGIDTDYYMGEYGQKDFFYDVETGRITPEEFHQKMAEATNNPTLTRAQVQWCWDGFIVGVEPQRLNFLTELKRHYRLGLLSNTNPYVIDKMDSASFSAQGLPISHYFHDMFLSCQMGLYKPDSAIFHKALEMGGMKAEETLFIDDSLRNTQGAAAAGLHTLHIPTNASWIEPLKAWLADNAQGGCPL